MHTHSIPCPICGTIFHPLAYAVKQGQGKFCSRACFGKSIKRKTEDLFWRNVEKSDGCWLWTGNVTQVRGYGRICQKPPVYAHRFSYELHFGKIDDGLYVCHRCDVPACVRPDHLFLGTAADNSADRNRKMRHPFGERHHKAKLTAGMVILIRERYVMGETQSALAKAYGVSQSNIGRIVRGEGWAHI